MFGENLSYLGQIHLWVKTVGLGFERVKGSLRSGIVDALRLDQLLPLTDAYFDGVRGEMMVVKSSRHFCVDIIEVKKNKGNYKVLR